MSSGCGCKEVHVYIEISLYYLSLLLFYLLFLQQHPYFLFIFFMLFVL